MRRLCTDESSSGRLPQTSSWLCVAQDHPRGRPDEAGDHDGDKITAEMDLGHHKARREVAKSIVEAVAEGAIMIFPHRPFGKD